MKVVFAAFGALCVFLCLLLFGFWLFLSVVTSGFKAIGHDCGSTYGIELFVHGNLFCPRK